MKNNALNELFSSNVIPDGATVVIPAASAPSREGVEFECISMRDPRGTRLLLEHDGGAIALVLACGDSLGPFSTGRLVIESIDPSLGARLVDRIASWLGFRLGAPSSEPSARAAAPSDEWVYFGSGGDSESQWDVYKLFLSRGDYSAEVFLRIDASGTRAQFLEKWDRYRADLVAIFEHAVHPAAPRAVMREEPLEPLRDGRRVLAYEGGLEIAVPNGWRVKEMNSFRRMIDPDETMAIEFSFMRAPPLKAPFPLEGRLGRVRPAEVSS